MNVSSVLQRLISNAKAKELQKLIKVYLFKPHSHGNGTIKEQNNCFVFTLFIFCTLYTQHHLTRGITYLAVFRCAPPSRCLHCLQADLLSVFIEIVFSG